MKEVIVKDADLQQAAMEGMDAFVNVFVKAIYDAIGGELTPETMAAEYRPDDASGVGYPASGGDGWRFLATDS